MKLRGTEKAMSDVLAIDDYIAAQGPGYADVVCERDGGVFSPRSDVGYNGRSGP